MSIDWKAEYLKSVESGCITLDELREARAELDATNRQVEILSDALAESRREHEPENEPYVSLASVQEPVAVARVDDLERGGRVRALAMGLALDAALYATPPAAQQEPIAQEPVAQCTNSDTWNCKYCRKTETCEALKDTRNFATPPAAPVQQESVGWTEVTDLDSLTVGDHIRVKKGGVLVAEIGFYSGSHDFEVTSSVSERLLIGEGLNKERIGQAVKKNHVCAPAKGWKVEVATPPAAPVLEGRDWSLLEATQESLREHMTEIKRLKEAQPAVPLTDEQINAIRFSIPTKAVTQRDFELARAIESAHGIREKGQP